MSSFKPRESDFRQLPPDWPASPLRTMFWTMARFFEMPETPSSNHDSSTTAHSYEKHALSSNSRPSSPLGFIQLGNRIFCLQPGNTRAPCRNRSTDSYMARRVRQESPRSRSRVGFIVRDFTSVRSLVLISSKGPHPPTWTFDNNEKALDAHYQRKGYLGGLRGHNEPIEETDPDREYNMSARNIGERIH